MKTIELFSGTKSFSKVANLREHSTFTIDNNGLFEPDVCCNILNLKLTKEFNEVDILWASPPCTAFSVASISSSWIGNYHPKRVETALGMAYVLKTLEIIKEIQKKNPNLIWFIENPRGVLRKMGFMEGLTRHTITYCQYGDDRMKPTDIWTNCKNWKPKPMCKNGDKCHTPAPRGSRTGTQGLEGAKDRSRVPEKLCLEIIKVCEESFKLSEAKGNFK